MKDIKDYLHLYLGCDVMWSGVRKANLIDTNKINCNLYFDGARYQTSISNVKPILRPLSSMTEDEAIDVCKFITEEKRWSEIEIIDNDKHSIDFIDGSRWQADGVDEMNDKAVYFEHINANQFQYLLSLHFDLFGLIEAGLAIST